LQLYFDAAQDRNDRAHNARAWIAYHVAGLARVRKFPSLRSLEIHRRPRRQSWQEQLDVMLMFRGTTVHLSKDKQNG
jgi:hypothetical protein